MFVYPRRARWRAVEQPHVPAPIMRIEESRCNAWESGGNASPMVGESGGGVARLGESDKGM